MVPIIDTFKCQGCGTCIKRCPEGIMGLINGRAALHVRLCVECGICAEVCPFGSIIFELPRFGGHEIDSGYRACR